MKTYLGDGCYVDFDSYALVLTTEDGIRETNRIVLEPEVYVALKLFVRRIRAVPQTLWDGLEASEDDK